ncbi:MAG: N-acetyltransferase [Clostridia bacterium]|nr:N-acetyltransferase [Clostridia bacterium]
MNVYESCPNLSTRRFTLRLVREEDAPGLLAVYSDRDAQPFFNADNCTSDFCYTTLPQMQECMKMWLWSYAQGYFVRWTILEEGVPVGTVEMFRRDDGEDGRGCGVLRVDVLSRLEAEDVFAELLGTLLQPMHELFGCAAVLTKAAGPAKARRQALADCGFVPAEPLTGHDGRLLGDYWVHRV